MKIANPLTRTPKPDPKITYQVVAGFVADTPTLPNWAPPVGATVRGDSPLLAYMFSIGAGRYFLPADADSAEVAQAFSAATYGVEAITTPDPSIRLREPSTHLMVCVKAIQIGDSMIAVGSLADAGDQWVRKFPDAWQKAPQDGYMA
jgi:hypothetical protein